MPLPEAIALIEAQLTNVFERRDVRVAGTLPSASVYRSGIRTNIHGELVHFVMVDIHKPLTMDRISDEDIEYIHEVTESFFEWLQGVRQLDTMLIWWVDPPVADFELGRSDNPELGAMAHISIPLCERYPRDIGF